MNTSESLKLLAAKGACRHEDPSLFHPGEGPDIVRKQAVAKQICATCVVRKPCLDFALSQDSQHGIWGGTTPEERRRMRST